MPIRSVTLRILGESRSARAEMDWVNKQADRLEARRPTIHIGIDTNEAALEKLRVRIDALKNLRANVPVDLDDRRFEAAFNTLSARLIKLDRTTAKPKISVEGMAKAVAEVAALETAFEKLHNTPGMVADEIAQADRRIGSIFKSGTGGFGIYSRILFGKVNLFGGLATIGALHLLADALLEVGIVWGTAAVAAGAFGIAAADATEDVIKHMKNLIIVSKATGQNIPPLTSHLQKLQDSVRPAVFQLFGDVLTVINTKTGVFAKLAQDAASVITHFGARIAVALRQGGGLNNFIDEAVPNLDKLFQSFASVGHIIGSLLSVMPGYVEILLNFGTTFLRLASYVVDAGKPIIAMGLWIHGFIVWAGLGVTLALAFGKAIALLGKTAIGEAIASFAVFIADLVTITVTAGVATAAIEAFETVMAFLADNPLVWVGAAVGAIAALVFWMSRSESETKKWGDSLQKNIDNASTIFEGLRRTQAAVGITGEHLAMQQQKLSRITVGANQLESFHTGVLTKQAVAFRNQAKVVGDSAEQYKRFNDEASFNAGRLSGLSKVYGGTTNALALLNAAGVTQAEWQDRSALGWAIVNQKIQGVRAGYEAMGQSGGTLNNDLQVMDRNITDQYQAMQKLNQAWDTFIGDVTGNQNNFDTFALGLQTLGKNFKSAAAATATTTHSFQGLKEKAALTGATMDGLSQASLTVNQAFTQSVVNANALFDSWRTAGLAGNLLTRGVKDAIAPMLKYASGSKEATAQLVALAQEAGFKGPVSFKALSNWVGHATGRTADLKKITNQATIQEALLTGAMNDQAKAISSQLLGQLDAAILRYGNVAKDVQAYGRAIAQQGRDSDAARSARTRLINDLIDTGNKAHLGKNAIAEMIHQITGIPLKRAIKIVEDGSGHFSISQLVNTPGNKSRIAQGNFPVGGLAAGGRVTGGIAGQDSVLGLLMPGEVVVPTRMVNAGAVDHLRGRLPRFADGGGVWPWGGSGPSPQGLGKAAVSFDQKFTKQFTDTMKASMTKAMKDAIQQAFAAQVPNVGGGTARWRGTVLRALAMEGLPAILAGRVLYQMQTESGGNPNAINLSDSNAAAGDPSRGLMQTIMSTFTAYHWPGTSWNIYNPLANIAAAINYARHRYGPSLMSGGMGIGSGHGYAMGTSGAAPGLALVGEQGPELVAFSGGETVMPAGQTRGLMGYAKGAGMEQIRGLSLMKEFMRDHTQNALRRDMHHFLKVIADYYSGQGRRWRDDMVRRQVHHLERIEHHLQHVKSTIAHEKAYRDQVFSNLKGFGALSNLSIGPTAGVGDNVALSGGQGLSSQLKDKIQMMRQFRDALKKLIKLKLPSSLFRQIVDMGPEQGLQYANELISGGPAFIKELSGEESQLTRLEHQVARGSASGAFQGKFTTSAKAFARGLREERATLEKEFKHLGRVLGEEAGRWFHVPKGKRPKGFALGGVLHEPVFGIGMSGQTYTFGEAGAEYFAPMGTPLSGGGTMGGMTVNITVQGDSDPDGAALRIAQRLREYKRRHGNASLGIG